MILELLIKDINDDYRFVIIAVLTHSRCCLLFRVLTITKLSYKALRYGCTVIVHFETDPLFKKKYVILVYFSWLTVGFKVHIDYYIKKYVIL